MALGTASGVNDCDDLLKFLRSFRVGVLGVKEYKLFGSDIDDDKEAFDVARSENTTFRPSYLDVLLGVVKKYTSPIVAIENQFDRLSKTLKVRIPTPEKYYGCESEARNFFASYYPSKSIHEVEDARWQYLYELVDEEEAEDARWQYLYDLVDEEEAEDGRWQYLYDLMDEEEAEDTRWQYLYDLMDEEEAEDARWQYLYELVDDEEG